LQLGHVLKLRGLQADAIECYRRAQQLDANSPASAELQHLEPRRPETAPIKLSVVLPSSGESSSLRERGDAARDAKQWQEAESYYSQYLLTAPADTAIWVQLGHTRKEMGQESLAEAAYRKAASLAPADPDPLIHLAHLLMRRSDAEAASIFERAFALEPNWDAYSALAELGYSPGFVHNGLSVKDCLFLDISDLLNFLWAHGTITGIQRVQLEIGQALSEAKPLAEFQELAFTFVNRGSGLIWRIDKSDFAALAGYCKGSKTDINVGRRLVDRARNKSVLVKPGANSAFVVLGAFWGKTYAPSLLHRIRAAGAKIGVFIHDIFPVTHPEFVGDGVTDHFEPELQRGIVSWDFILTNSMFTAKEVEQYIAAQRLPPITVIPVPLARGVTLQQAEGRSEAKWPSALAGLEGKPFVLCVSTIEVRKNHLALFHAWRMLQQSGLTPPPLVLAGKPGWRVESLIEQMEASGLLGSHIRLVNGLSDQEIATLYRNCLFTVLPSFLEGWGLPVGESLGYGKVCIASDTSSMREAGGDAAIYIDPYNTRSLFEALRSLLSDPKALRSREQSISQDFHARSWKEVGSDLLEAISAARQARSRASWKPDGPRLLRLGEELRTVRNPANFASAREQIRSDLERDLVLAEGWDEPEEPLTWLNSSYGRILFRSDQPKGARLRVMLLLRSTPWAYGNELTLSSLCDRTEIIVLPGSDMTASLEAIVDKQGLVEITVQLKGSTTPEPPEVRKIRVGLRAIFAAKAGLPVLAPLHSLDFGSPGELGPGWVQAARRQLTLADGWLQEEASGAWMAGRCAKIEFGVEAAERAKLRVLMEFVAKGDCYDWEVVLTPAGGEPLACKLPASGGSFLAWCDCTVSGGKIQVKLALAGESSPQPPARIGIRSLRYGSLDSFADRLALLESLLLPRMTAPAASDPPAYLTSEVNHSPDPVARTLTWLSAITKA
jgi:glycosyltransferase involved in cell wall biosynthesis